MKIYRFILSGGLAGGISAFTFAVLHAVLISDIWFSLAGLVSAGVICGICVGCTYGLLFETYSPGNWLLYNGIYLGMFVLLGTASVLIFEPMTTIPELMGMTGPPIALFKTAMPLTMISTLVMVVLIGRLFGRTWKHYGAILLTCTVLVILLGLNVSVLGLVSVSGSSVYLIAELFGFIFALNVVYVFVFMGFERNSWRRSLNPGTNRRQQLSEEKS